MLCLLLKTAFLLWETTVKKKRPPFCTALRYSLIRYCSTSRLKQNCMRYILCWVLGDRQVLMHQNNGGCAAGLSPLREPTQLYRSEKAKGESTDVRNFLKYYNPNHRPENYPALPTKHVHGRYWCSKVSDDQSRSEV